MESSDEHEQRTSLSSIITITENVEITYDAIMIQPAACTIAFEPVLWLASFVASFSHLPRAVKSQGIKTCMSHYLNPLHAPVPSEFHSQYSSLYLANPKLDPPFPTSLPSSFKRVPQPPPSTSSSRRTSIRVPIIFELIGAPSRGLGIPMRELVVRSGGALERMIVDANEPVGYLISGSIGIRQTTLRISWPGYDHVHWTHSLDLFSPAGPVTRGMLAVQIADAFCSYVSQMGTQAPSSCAASWRLGSRSSGGIAFERLVLIALWNASDDHWMAEIYIDSR